MRTGPPAIVAFRPLLRQVLALLCLVLFACAAGAAPTSALRFKRLGALATDDLSVMSMLQDRQGFIWIGTLNGGLYRYDGYHAVKYAFDPTSRASLPGDRITMLYEDTQARIWVATREGLARFNAAQNNFTRFEPAPLPGVPRVVTNIISDGKDGMWLATWAGLQHFDPATGKIEQYLHDEKDPASLATNGVDAMVRDAQGGIWVATWPAGLDYLAPGSRSFRHYRLDSEAAPDGLLNIVHALHIDVDQRLWIGTGRGVWRYKLGTDWSTRTRLPSPDGRINSFHADPSGALWAGTMTAGLLRFARGSDALTTYSYRASDPYSLPTSSIAAVMRDRTGTLWVGSYNAGVSVANLGTRGFARLIPPEVGAPDPRPNNTLQAIAPGGGGRVWLGGLSGVVLYNPASGRVERHLRAAPGQSDSLATDNVNCLYQQSGGPLWVGTAAGLHRVDLATGAVTVSHFGERAYDRINTIAPGSGGKLWLGTANSVIRYDTADGSFVNYPHHKDKPNTRRLVGASTVLEDGQGRVWMGSEYTNGLDMFDTVTGQFSYFRHDDKDPASLADDAISALHQDSAGRIWAGTAKGLSEIVTQRDGSIAFRAWPGAVGLARVFAVHSDEAGRIWLATSSAITRFDPTSGKALQFTPSDGLIDSYRAGPVYAAPDGALHFIGSAGATVVQPDDVQVDSIAPQVAITDISVYNRSLGLRPLPDGVELSGPLTNARSLVLGPEHTVFALEFAALHYNDPLRNQYAYQLVGFDRDWVQSDAVNRRITYTNLNPGTYLFKVRAANDRGLWQAEPTTLEIRILPPLWRTWWFRTAAVLLVLASLAWAYRLRVRSLTQQKQRLSALVAERTRELEESNGKLALSNAKLAAQSLTDGLTGVTNRRGFDAALADEWARARRAGTSLALVMFDVDHFKLYNDHYGHQAGDECLREVAAAIAACARRTGDVAARYGGEEFALLLPNTDAQSALALAQEVCGAIAALGLPHAPSSYGVATASAGVATVMPQDDAGILALVRDADQALYRAKQAGRNRAVAAMPDGFRREPVQA